MVAEMRRGRPLPATLAGLLALALFAGAPARAAESPEEAAQPAGSGVGEGAWLVYTVAPGDTLYSLARRFGTTVPLIAAANGLESAALQVGQTLRIPRGAVETASAVDEERPEGRRPAPEPQTAAPAEVSADLYLLAQLITAEAGGEPFSGQVAVGAVVLNRVASGEFPGAVREVIFQAGQFEVVALDRLDRPPTAQALIAARMAWFGVDPTGGALFFYNPDLVQPTAFWANRSILITIGGHAFAR